METIIKTNQETLTLELANAIATIDIAKINELLSDKGEYCIQDEKGEPVLTNKTNYINWLSNRFDEFLSSKDDCDRLNYIIDKCSYCRIGNPVIIFENGKFPVLTTKDWESEECGLILEFDGNIISDISFCFLFLTTENPYLYEKRKCLRH